ncbi:hypothetical protein [Trinickia fusca]|uniref:Uncharacterized protein n=1 Tax=Trinickia fusca TaxID=2419777 RepID=A0A494X9X5_9BURK|nr:hypothetical protein [Trinickia fusca]RKP46471.1 hypothetical protein D7S89_17775 [Trinickia fusca]
MDATPGLLDQSISAVLAAVGRGLPLHATLSDEIVRYFMVTPPANNLRMQDLRGAADMRFQTLYGESVVPWQVVADWQADLPFLACAVPQRVLDALRAAATAERGRLISVTPAFAAAWNDLRRDISSDAWLATLSGGTLTLGVIAGSVQPRLVAVRTLVLQDTYGSTDTLCDEVARAALLENVPPPALLHIHGQSSVALQSRSASPAQSIVARACVADIGESGHSSDGVPAPANFVQNGATT